VRRPTFESQTPGCAPMATQQCSVPPPQLPDTVLSAHMSGRLDGQRQRPPRVEQQSPASPWQLAVIEWRVPSLHATTSTVPLVVAPNEQSSTGKAGGSGGGRGGGGAGGGGVGGGAGGGGLGGGAGGSCLV
jgi:uncharacterized membrane protein YgcG